MEVKDITHATYHQVEKGSQEQVESLASEGVLHNSVQGAGGVRYQELREGGGRREERGREAGRRGRTRGGCEEGY